MRGWAIALGVALVVAMIILFAVCSGDGSGDPTTTSGISSTTPAETSTTSATETPTTTEAVTTTSVAETTTTVDNGLLEGNWAPEPLVVASFGALGWWDGAGWVQATEGTPLPVAGGEDYQVALLGVEAITTGGAEELVCDPLLNPGVVLEDPDLLGGGHPEPYGVAISAPWSLTPQLVETAVDDGAYAAVAADLLAERGLTVPDPVIKQVFRTDLEGDGVNEVVVVAEDVPPSLLGEPGDYSIAFLQRVIDADITTIVFGESVLVETEEGETPFILSFAVAAVADLNGDGRMEIVLDSTYYEGSAVEIWEYVGDDLGLQQQIGTGCGV